MTNPLTTAFTLFTRECEQELLHLIRKYACVKVLSFIFNYNQSQSYPNKNLQLKYMNQQNIVVETIINKIISRSRKNSLESIDCRTISQKSEISNESQTHDQEYIIKMSDLREFGQKIALENYQNNIALQIKTRENKDLKNQTQKWKTQFEQLKKTLENREQIFKKRVEEADSKTLKEKKKREQIEMELNWSTNKIKDQMRQIEKLKHSTIAKNQPKSENQNGSAYHTNKDKNEYVTPGKQGSKKLQNLGAKNCESIEYSLLNSDIVSKFMDNHPPTIKQCSTEQSKQAKIDRNCVLNALQNHSSKKHLQNTNIEISRFHRHAQIDEKQRIIKMLGEKCLFMQSYIEKLARKYLGEVIYNQQNDRLKQDRVDQYYESTANLKVIEQNSASSMQRSQSEVGLSSAFKVQPEL